MTQQDIERLEQIIYSELRKYEHSPLVAHDVSQALTKRIRALTAAPTVTDADLGEIARFAGTKNDAARLTHKLTTDAAPKATEGAAMAALRELRDVFVDMQLESTFGWRHRARMALIKADALLASPIAPPDKIDQVKMDAALADCPHATPFRYCPECVVSPCPIGLGRKP